MLDADPAHLTKVGQLAIDESGITLTGFEGERCSCREVAVLALVWAIGELQRELMATLMKPGSSNVVVD